MNIIHEHQGHFLARGFSDPVTKLEAEFCRGQAFDLDCGRLLFWLVQGCSYRWWAVFGILWAYDCWISGSGEGADSDDKPGGRGSEIDFDAPPDSLG